MARTTVGERDSRPSEYLCGNSGTPEPEKGPVVPLFPLPPDFRGHNPEKCGTGLE